MELKGFEIRGYHITDEAAVIQLWRDCDLIMPWNDPYQDIQRKLKVQADLFLVGLLSGRLVASVMAGYEGHRGWINYLAVAPDLQRRGIGRIMMGEAEARLRQLGCPKINLLIRVNNSDVYTFYQRIGFKEDDVLSMGKRLEHDD